MNVDGFGYDHMEGGGGGGVRKPNIGTQSWSYTQLFILQSQQLLGVYCR